MIRRQPGLVVICVAAIVMLSLARAPVAWGAFGQQRANISKAVVSKSALPAGGEAMLAVVLEIDPGFHAQSRTPLEANLIKFDLKLDPVPALEFGEAVYPPGTIETYPALGQVSVYTGDVVVRVPVKVKGDAPAGPIQITGRLRYQACDAQACYPPETPKFKIDTSVVAASAAVEANEAELFADAQVLPPPGPVVPAPPAPAKVNDAPSAASTTAPATQAASTSAASMPPMIVDDASPKWGAMFALLMAFVAGILFNIVPCVLPVLPIKVLGFAEVAKHDRGKTISLATTFGAGIVSVFAVLAILILGLKKITWGQQFSNPYFAWGIIILLLVLSLWLFGVFNFNLPTAAYAFTPRHDTYPGNFVWGILTAILSTPCTGPLFPPLMLWAQSQPTALGVPAMMMVGVGMAFPYVLLSAFPEAARSFPRVGPWSELFKQMLGFILLGFTVFFAAGRFTHPAGQWWATVPVAVLAALYLMARTVQLTEHARPVAISAVLSVAIVTASVLTACRFSGVFDQRPAGGAMGEAVNWTPYSDSALEAARSANKIVLIKFTANWCLNCQYVEATVYHDQTAIESLRKHDVVTLKADLTDEDAPGWSRLRELTSTGGIPLTAIYAPGYSKPVQIASVYTTDTLVKTLDKLDAAKAVAAR